MSNVNHWSDGEEGAQAQDQQNRCREIFTMVDRDKSGFVDEKGALHVTCCNMKSMDTMIMLLTNC